MALLCLLAYAYIFVGGDLTAEKGLGNLLGSEVGLPAGRLVFFCGAGFCVWRATRLVDRLTSILIGSHYQLFLGHRPSAHACAAAGVVGHTSRRGHTLLDLSGRGAAGVFASFGFHGNVSSLLKYFNGDAPKWRARCGQAR